MSLGLFEGFGVELEHMIVDRESLRAAPIADRLLEAAAGELTSELSFGNLAWSNELVLHVLETKTDGPTRHLDGDLVDAFDRAVTRADDLLAPWGARLLPTAMHPTFDPQTETRLWPHEHSPVYRAYDRIFGCRGHGWSNLQSTHLNLPFSGDEEFGRLHSAVRLVLPLLPALAASSPVVEGRVTGLLDHRLEVYRTNSRRFASITGAVIPEPVTTRAEYERQIFAPMYRDVAPLDPEGVLRDEFLNARGAIARFGRGSIEIRLLDVQEAPCADLAVVAAVVGVLRLLVEERWSPWEEQTRWPTETLAGLLLRALGTAERTVVDDRALLATFGLDRVGHRPGEGVTLGELWRHLIDRSLATGHLDPSWADPLAVILDHGPLARRMVTALGNPDAVAGPVEPDRLADLYRRLGDCLARGELFVPSPAVR